MLVSHACCAVQVCPVHLTATLSRDCHVILMVLAWCQESGQQGFRVPLSMTRTRSTPA